MTDFRFAEPQRAVWLWALIGLLVVLAWIEFRWPGRIARFLSPVMAQRLARGPSRSRRILRLALLGLAGLALILALMRPQWGIHYEQRPQVGAQIMVCLDVSRSMLAEDTAPNRLERAKAELVDLLSLLQHDQVGLIAFAGKATVLSPLTTDFGFLKLLLDEAGPQTVGRGGTRLEEPIRAAVAGFGDAADLARVILLITDGDDLDSFPLDAAKEAHEKGIRILAIGFGDEAGSKISVTDPRTGLQSFIKDPQGNPVISRLNGELLRELALATEGAYIPAATGALDLAEIHATHIGPLLRAETEGVLEQVENEGFQWALAAALLLLMMSLAVTVQPSPRTVTHADRGAARVQTAALCLLAVASGIWTDPAQAAAEEEAAPTASAGDLPPSDTLPESNESADSVESADSPALSPREAYNLAVSLMPTDAEQAARQLENSRVDAGVDGELRYRAAYNLGWLAAQQADELLESDPQEALARLRVAIDWYQRAVRLRPKSDEARQNLEILMRRSVALADALAQRDAGNIPRRLDELISGQRDLLGKAADVLGHYDGAPRHALDTEEARRDFRRLGVDERQVLSDAEAVAELLSARIMSLADPSASSSGPDGQAVDPREAARLQAAADDLTQAIQRLGKARSQFRLREGDRGFRRAHLALEELKSARDQLREPGERLRMLLGDAVALLGQTNQLVGADDAASVPSWLDTELLAGSQTALLQRTEQISAQLSVPDDAGGSDQGPGLSEQQLRDVRAAHEAMTAAGDAFRQSLDALDQQDPEAAAGYQAQGVAELRRATEYLIELRGLIELVYRDADAVDQTLQAWDALDAEVDRKELTTRLAALHAKNLARAERLAGKIEDELASLAEGEPLGPQPAVQVPGSQPPADPEEAKREERQERLLTAQQLLQDARDNMARLATSLPELAEPAVEDPPSEAETPNTESPGTESPNTESPAAEPAGDERDTAAADDSSATETTDPDDPKVAGQLGEARSDADEMMAHLTELRRLFYSIAEHLEETAQRQADVNDQTQGLAADTDADTNTESPDAEHLGPLQAKQAEIQQKSAQIAEALGELSQAAPTTGDAPDTATDNASAQIEQYQQAAQLVAQAAESMEGAQQQMGSEPVKIGEIRSSQDKALQKLIEALALLKPPSENQNQEGSGEEQQEDQQQQQQASQSEQLSEAISTQQLLQLVRDREAQRRRQQNRQLQRRQPVDRDW